VRLAKAVIEWVTGTSAVLSVPAPKAKAAIWASPRPLKGHLVYQLTGKHFLKCGSDQFDLNWF
jgi:hypothetical protein